MSEKEAVVVEKFGVEFTIYPYYQSKKWLSLTETKVSVREVEQGAIFVGQTAYYTANHGLMISSDGTLIDYRDVRWDSDDPLAEDSKIEYLGDPEIFLYSLDWILDKNVFSFDSKESESAFDNEVESFWYAMEHGSATDAYHCLASIFPGLSLFKLGE